MALNPWDDIDLDGWQQAILEEHVQWQQRALNESHSPMMEEVQAGLATGSASQPKPPKRVRGQTVGKPSNRATIRNKRTVELNPPGDDDINLPEATMEDVEENYVDQEQLRMKLSDLSIYAAAVVSESKPGLHTTFARQRKGWAIRGVHIQANWSSLRSSLAAMQVAAGAPPPPSAVCGNCGERRALLRCKTCIHVGDGHKLLCGSCDQALHLRAHLHRRDVWVFGYYESIPAQTQFEEDGKVATVGTCSRFTVTICKLFHNMHGFRLLVWWLGSNAGKHFGVLPHKCNKCGNTGTFVDQPVAESPLLYIKHGE